MNNAAYAPRGFVTSTRTFDVNPSRALASIDEQRPRRAAAPQGRLIYLCAYAHTQMTKTISLSEEAYRLLRRHKLASESFSDTVTRLARQGGKLSEVVGLYPELRGRTGLANLVRENRRRLDRQVGAR